MSNNTHTIIIKFLSSIIPLGTLIALDTPELNIVYNIGIVLSINVIIIIAYIFQLSLIEKFIAISKKKYFLHTLLCFLFIIYSVPTFIQELNFRHNLHHYLSCFIAILIAFYCVKHTLKLERKFNIYDKITPDEITIMSDYICLFIQFSFIQVVSRYKMYPHKNFDQVALRLLQFAMIITYIIIGLSLWYISHIIFILLKKVKSNSINQFYPLHIILLIISYFVCKSLMVYYYTNNPVEDDYYVAGYTFAFIICIFSIIFMIIISKKSISVILKIKILVTLILGIFLFVYITFINNIDRRTQNFNFGFSHQNINYIVNICSLVILFLIPVLNILLDCVLDNIRHNNRSD